jgi:hypothetical protein
VISSGLSFEKSRKDICIERQCARVSSNLSERREHGAGFLLCSMGGDWRAI